MHTYIRKQKDINAKLSVINKTLRITTRNFSKGIVVYYNAKSFITGPSLSHRTIKFKHFQRHRNRKC